MKLLIKSKDSYNLQFIHIYINLFQILRIIVKNRKVVVPN